MGPKTRDQTDARPSAETGFSSQATAPAEYAASRASEAMRRGAMKTTRSSPPCSRISRAAKWPSNDGRSRERSTNSGSIRMYSSTAWSPSSQMTTLKFLALKRLANRWVDMGLLSTRRTVGAAVSSTSETKPMGINHRQDGPAHQTTATLLPRTMVLKGPRPERPVVE